MSSSGELPPSVVAKLRAFLQRGEAQLEAIDALLRRLGVDSLNTADLNHEDTEILLAIHSDEIRHQTIRKAQRWVDDLDEYASGYLPKVARERITRHPTGRSGSNAGDLIEDARTAIRDRARAVNALIGEAVPRPARVERDSTGGWNHLRDLGLVDSAVLDGYLRVMRTRRTIAQRRTALAPPRNS
ncbi:hypothetical protein [Actinoallomurus rhizosphaericola]|uniref:hypothetical protein n=1 Tax=Actinoallomurus rhizosphaericola TaxID=2952536 RepID=UPI0020929F87|nr:hypothetical protein [Actinoallomurus rhizosphaericola]MCO5995766.1 hypothetical protein [Actinoallomurus rhizosphaericola]